jgi:hypothetical protein
VGVSGAIGAVRARTSPRFPGAWSTDSWHGGAYATAKVVDAYAFGLSGLMYGSTDSTGRIATD